MKRSKLAKIETTLMKFVEGELYEPVPQEGAGVYHAINKRLETLRLTLLRLKDEEVEQAKRTNSSIAAVAHDMKTPLSVICGYAECLSDGMDDKDYASLILQKADQMNEMVLAMVEDSHKSIEDMQERKAPVGAREYFHEVCNRLTPLVEAKGITFKYKKAPDVTLRLDSHQFGRVMQNLVSNAVKYSPAGTKIKVTFKLWAKTLRITVKDQGEGIARKDLPYIFDQFYRSDASRTDPKSNGLGLYITKEIVREHGGRIYCVSKKGKGSAFTVVLPVEPRPDKKRSITDRFNSMPLWGKLATDFVFGWLLASIYRLARYFETRNISTLIFSFVSLFMFPFIWFIDFLSVLVYGKITFLAD